MRITPNDAEAITPQMALEMLTRNTRNRPFKEHSISKYAHELRTGTWVANGESIKFSETGVLMDGQNRLKACLRTGIPFKTLVIYDIPDKFFNTIDSGVSRSAADVLSISTLGTDNEVRSNRTSIAASIKIIDAYYKGKLSINGYLNSYVFLNKDMDELGRKYKDAHECIKDSIGIRGMMAPSQFAALSYIFKQIDINEGIAFIEDFKSGACLASNDPVFVARETAQFAKDKKRRHPTYWLFGLMIKAWNIRRQKHTCKALKFSDTEDFPVAI